MFLMVLIPVLLSAYFYIIKPDRANKSRKEIPLTKLIKKRTWKNDIEEWLTKYNPYYKSLSADEKERFIYRTMQFQQAKEFRFHAMVEEEHIPILISSAAVQMTFGLRNYLMDYFPVIHITRNEYVLNIDKETYYGHVSRQNICISWKHFMEGYEEYDDSLNLGLHEMAHAVAYDLFLGEQDRHDILFRERFDHFTEKAKPVFLAMQEKFNPILDDYGSTNFHEFWAVCTETFFERSEKFRQVMPELYLAICELLNQDPLKAGKIIDPELAGLVI